MKIHRWLIQNRFSSHARIAAAVILITGAAAIAFVAASPPGAARPRVLCQDNSPLCTEVADSLNYDGKYTGHDEPSLLFYSNTPGSGHSNLYRLTLPKDPPTLPVQNGTGGTFNFQLHPAFWVGMAMCDDQSAPNPGGSSVGPTVPCTPDSDSNIYPGTTTSDPHFIGKHPGAAFMEMQFYPPGWVPWPAGNSCDPTKWCAALNIDSLSENMNTGQFNNGACLDSVGPEPVNFAFITKSGVADFRGDPQDFRHFTPVLSTALLMNSGDQLTVDLHDTSDGFTVIIKDLTTGETGSMTASVANGFAQIKFDPTATTCTSLPSAFHPMYATSSEDTRVPWAAHSYNVAFSDEIGHFEYCAGVDSEGGNCIAAGANDPGGVDSDDVGCFSAASSTRVQIGGCLGTDIDFDGVPYQNTWPGTGRNHGQDKKYHPSPILFSSPTFNGGTQDYDRVAFEADLPRIEAADFGGNCNRTTGANCVNPPPGANFYPIYSTTQDRGDHGDGSRDEGGQCTWQLGGPKIPGTTNTFGGNSTAEFGPLLLLAYPVPGGTSFRYNNFRNVLSSNPCPSANRD
jgi:hypothetical protein